MKRNKEMKALIIDDDDNIYLSLEHHFSGRFSFIQLLRARNGKEGIDIIENTPGIDFILLDYKMPVQDGLETLKVIRNYDSEIPVIMMSGNDVIKEKALEFGATHFIEKPFSNDFESLIEETISNKKKGG
ncbi:MAG: response regulator [bacterium]|nr:response regulator [bacterium]